jgi:hypothetical protein
MILANQEMQKQRVTEYLTQQFAEKEALREECNRLQVLHHSFFNMILLFALLNLIHF